MTGEELARMLEEIAKTPADVVARVRDRLRGEVTSHPVPATAPILEVGRELVEQVDHLRIDRHAVAARVDAPRPALLAGQPDGVDAGQGLR